MSNWFVVKQKYLTKGSVHPTRFRGKIIVRGEGNMYVKYKGMRVIIKNVNYSFDFVTFNYPNHILIYINKDLDKHIRSKILHKTLKKARG